MMHNPLADAISVIKNAEKTGKKECVVSHVSNVLRGVLATMQKYGYVEKFELQEDGRGGKFKVGLSGKINDCNVITPRFSARKGEYETWEKRFLPAAGVGILIVSTPEGIKSHREVKGKTGGILLAYVY